MVVDPDGEGVRVESDCWIAKKSTLVCQEPWSPLEGTKETAECVLDATTNLEGGKKCWHEVRGELFCDYVLDRFVLKFFANHFLFRFLETLESLGTSIVRMPPESPCRRLGNCLFQEAKRHGIFGKDEVNEVVE